MDLGIRGRRAIVCASSKGLGRACAEALAEAGVDLVVNARNGAELEATAAAIRARSAVKVTAVPGDIATEATRKAVLAACPQPDILVNNAGGPPPGDFREWGREAWLRAIDANMLTPIELIKATVDGMIGRGFGRIVNITSSAVKAPIETLGLSNGARSGLTGFVAGLARKTVRSNVTINNLLPGSFATDRLESFIQSTARHRGLSRDEAVAALEAQTPAGRFGRPPEFGAACAFLCSIHAGYITGQNWLLDGGEYPGTF
jgi:3-oxoacyl-[acyl-carrier protein] reductase